MTTTSGLPNGDSVIGRVGIVMVRTLLGLGLGAVLGWWTGDSTRAVAEGAASGAVMVVSLWEVIDLIRTVPFDHMRRSNWVGYAAVALTPILVVGMAVLYAWPRGTSYIFDFRTAWGGITMLVGYAGGVLRMPDYHARRYRIGVLVVSVMVAGLSLPLVGYDLDHAFSIGGLGGLVIPGMVAELRAHPDRP
jgi:hypothetical protein